MNRHDPARDWALCINLDISIIKLIPLEVATCEKFKRFISVVDQLPPPASLPELIETPH